MFRSNNGPRPSNYEVRLQTANQWAEKILAEYGDNPEGYSDRVLAFASGNRRMEYLIFKAIKELSNKRYNAKKKQRVYANAA